MKKNEQWHQPELSFKPKPMDKYKEAYEKNKESAEEFFSHVSKGINKLSKSEFEYIYWTHLAKVGWKIYDERHIALSCLVCGDPMGLSVDINTIGKMEVTDLPYLKNPKKHIQSHNKTCKGEPNE